VGARLGAGQKAGAQYRGLRPQSQDGNHAAGVPDAAGGIGLRFGVNNDLVGGNGRPVINPRSATNTPANNGVTSLTLALLPSSPALRRGSNPDNLLYDQRGPGFPRMTQGLTDIGAFQLSRVPLLRSRPRLSR
jgi:hypothetical protein